MKKIALVAAPLVLSLAIAACGSTDDPDSPAEADTVEMPADEVMTQPGMDGDPAIDESVTDDATASDVATEAPADQAADAAADAAADLEAAMSTDAASE